MTRGDQVRSGHARPLSPHIMIHRWNVTAVMSIAHRATGVAIYAGTALVAWYLAAAAFDPDAYARARAVSGTWAGTLVRMIFSWILLHHAVGGWRYFVSDAGYATDATRAARLAYVTAIAPVVLTGVAWTLSVARDGGAS